MIWEYTDNVATDVDKPKEGASKEIPVKRGQVCYIVLTSSFFNLVLNGV